MKTYKVYTKWIGYSEIELEASSQHYKELSKTSDDVEWIEQEASRLAEIDLDNFEMEG